MAAQSPNRVCRSDASAGGHRDLIPAANPHAAPGSAPARQNHSNTNSGGRRVDLSHPGREEEMPGGSGEPRGTLHRRARSLQYATFGEEEGA